MNVLDRSAPPRAAGQDEDGKDEGPEKDRAPGAPQVLVVRTPDERLIFLQPIGSRRRGDVGGGIPGRFTGSLITDGYTTSTCWNGWPASSSAPSTTANTVTPPVGIPAHATSEYLRGDRHLRPHLQTFHILQVIDSPPCRRGIKGMRNLQEGRHALGEKMFHGSRRELFQRYREGMEDQLGALGIALNCVVLWNTVYTDAALNRLRAQGYPVRDEDVARLGPFM